MDRETPNEERQHAAGALRNDTRNTEPDGTPGTTIEPSDYYARNLAETSGAMFMYTSMAGIFCEADALAFVKYRDKLLVDCGSPHDPVEKMLIEQLALAHLNAGRLHFRAATAESLEGARVYGGLAVLLQGELRRTALALKAYRATARPQGVLAEDASSDTVNEPAPAAVQKTRRRRTGW